MKDIFTGLVFVAFGIFFNYFSREYNIGDSSNMGAGFYPYYLSLLLIGVGLIISIKGMLWKS